MSAAAHPVPFREVRQPTVEADELRALLAELEAHARQSPQVVKEAIRKLVWDLRDRRKQCYRCASISIGRRRPKRGQRAFCEDRPCKSEQTSEDYATRAPGGRNR